jgi:serine/threonine protein kinase
MSRKRLDHAGDPVPELPPELANHPRFRIVRELGRGGMGAVYLAEHRLMERPVAIKVINKALLDRPDSLPRFLAEIKAAALLNHDGIVRAYDAEQAGELHMLVMEYIEGLPLDKIVQRKGPLPPPHACGCVRQAALGLQHAFEQGMTHRDIKPQNLMLTPQGKVKILDFGLARVLGERAGHTGLTQEGIFLGTPHYVAPEQATNARQADIRADIYSLGCTLYFLLTGRPPFAEDTVVQQVLAHLEQEPTPVHELRPDVPAALSAVVARMLAKNPAQRFQEPAQVAHALASFCKPGPMAAASLPPPLPSAASPNRGTVSSADTSPLPQVRELAAGEPAPFRTPAEPAPKRQSAARPRRRGLPGWAWMTLGVAALAVVAALGGALYVSTNKGTIQIELSDRAAEVEIKIDGGTVSLAALEEPLRLRAGDHELVITGKNFETVRRLFTVERGDNPVLRVELIRTQDAQRATGVPAGKPWISLVPPKSVLKTSKHVRYEKGLLDVGEEGCHLTFPVSGRDMVIRGQVRAVGGQNQRQVSLLLRAGPAGFYQAYYFPGGRFRLDFFDHVKGSITLGVSESAFQFDDFFEFTFSAVGNRLEVTANGKKVLEVTDSSLRAGACGVQAYMRAGQFKDMQVQVLDEPLPRNRWLTLNPAEANLSKGTYQNGVVTLEPGGQLAFPAIHCKDLTLRALVKKPDWGEGFVHLNIRFEPGAWSGYAATFSKRADRASYDFGIVKHFNDGEKASWIVLKSSDGKPVPGLDADDFFEFSFSAVGDNLSVAVNGQPVLEVHDPDYKEGTLKPGTWQSRGLFKDIRLKIHDPD